MSKETTGRTFSVALVLSLVCAVIVSVSAVALRPTQQLNKELDRKKNILAAAGLLEEGASIEAVFEEKIRPEAIEISTGEVDESTDVATFNQVDARKSSDMSVAIPSQYDVSGFKKRSKYAVIYEVLGANKQVETVILPVFGYGLWSTMYGYLAIDAVTQKVVGIGFYQHAETPGLGGEIDNPLWKAKWEGKTIFDENGSLALTVIKGQVVDSDPKASYSIDGLAGATLTTNGLRTMVQYWLGPHGFAPYLETLRTRGNPNG